jgi:hypothetical protein
MAMMMAKLFDIAATMLAMAKNEDKFLKKMKRFVCERGR